MDEGSIEKENGSIFFCKRERDVNLSLLSSATPDRKVFHTAGSRCKKYPSFSRL